MCQHYLTMLPCGRLKNSTFGNLAVLIFPKVVYWSAATENLTKERRHIDSTWYDITWEIVAWKCETSG